MSKISVSEFIKKSINDNIIDIRGIESYNHNHIPGSKNVQFEKLIVKPQNYIDKSKPCYIYCQKGIKSLKACRMLRSMGYNAINIEGGYEEWMLEK